MDQSADELSAGALHAGDDVSNVISSGLIKVGREADVLLRRSWVQGERHESNADSCLTLLPIQTHCSTKVLGLCHL